MSNGSIYFVSSHFHCRSIHYNFCLHYLCQHCWLSRFRCCHPRYPVIQFVLAVAGTFSLSCLNRFEKVGFPFFQPLYRECLLVLRSSFTVSYSSLYLLIPSALQPFGSLFFTVLSYTIPPLVYLVGTSDSNSQRFCPRFGVTSPFCNR
jgi:hypothetical protein